MWNAGDECLKHKRLYAVTLCAAVICACIVSVSIPVKYTSRCKISAEKILFSLDIGDDIPGFLKSFSKASDVWKDNAPELYMYIMQSEDFKKEIARIPVATKDRTFSGTFGDYIMNCEQRTWWADGLSRPTLSDAMDDHVKFEINRKTKVITIQVCSQDARLSAMMTDSVKHHLQDFITRHNVNKNKTDLVYLKKLRREAGIAYHEAQDRYAAFCDSHMGSSIKAVETRRAALESERSIAFNNYQKYAQLYKRAEMLTKRNEINFTTIEPAGVSLKPSNPNWTANILVWVFYSQMLTTLFILYRRKLKERKGGAGL